ncbi:MAG TPA: hypothetical protein VFZ22_00175 [Pyrinomonadaceae bacterium]|nr:hypothetical protein [Pyrinomonadaceae bacterium]
MNDDYLWDKSGEPDPQIQELEEILAPLRYQPKPLQLPNDVRRKYFRLLAIAATVLIALLAAGVWLKVRKQHTIPPQEAKSVVPSELHKEPEIVKNTDLSSKPIVRKRIRKKTFSQRERQEAREAKEQVLLALRVASEKLKLAQRRTQGPSLNQIKNQHKVG